MDKALALPWSATEIFLKSVVDIIKQVVGIEDTKKITPDLEIGGTDVGADSLDCTEIIIWLEFIWGVNLNPERSPTYGYLKLRVEDLSAVIADSLKKFFKIKNFDNEFMLLQIRVRQTVFSSLQRLIDKSVIKENESTIRKIINDKIRIVSDLYLGSEKIQDLELSIMNNFKTNIKININRTLNKHGDITIGQLCNIVYNRLLIKGNFVSKLRHDL